MADKIHNPLPVPEKRPHEEMDYDFPLQQDDENGAEDDFDIEISDDDDFDI
ncbi:MAG: hypothetical protein IJV26_05540 [Lachnospiraceae bacterium]|nr:hypothetical protein [Lachnospiraceae bacterium]